jgi:CelD/BcsL family acetyltransferase involved in cellulose biosynthesis
MDVCLLTELSELEAISDAWMELYRTDGRSPFQNPELHRIWWQHLGLREGWSPLLAVGRQGGRLVGVASFAVRRSRMLRILEWAGTAAFDYPEMLLAKVADAAPLWQAVQRSGCFDIARLRWVRSDAVGRQPLLGFARKLEVTHPIHAIELVHRNGQTWLDSLPRSVRAEHRDKLRQLTKLGPVTMRQVTQTEEIASAVQTLVRFKAEWSQSRDTETVYLSDGMAAYFEDVALAALRDQTLHLTTLDCGGQTLAAHLGFASQDGFYYYVSSYDIGSAKLSPGRVHMNLMVMWAIDNGLQRFDFLRGEADYKTRLGSVSRQLEDYTFSGGFLGTAALQAYLWQQNRRAGPLGRDREALSVSASASPAL